MKASSRRMLTVVLIGLAMVPAAARVVIGGFPSTGSSTTTKVTVVESDFTFSNTDPFLMPLIQEKFSTYGFDEVLTTMHNEAYAAFLEATLELEADLMQPLRISASTMTDVMTTILSQIGIGDPESPDFIVLHTDYLETTTITTSYNLHFIPEPSTLV
jgi:hypothetical protein